MNTEILGVVVQIALMVILAYPLGKYIAKVYKGEKTWSDFMAPVERVIYKVLVCPSVSIFQLKWGWVLSIATGFSKFSQRRSFKMILRPDSQPDISNNRVTK